MERKKPPARSSDGLPKFPLRTARESIRGLETMTERLRSCSLCPEEKARECGKILASHLSNIKSGRVEPPGTEEKVRSALADYPLQHLAHDFVVGNETFHVIDELRTLGKSEAIRGEAKRSLGLAMEFLNAIAW